MGPIALVTQEDLPDWEQDDRPFHAALATRGVAFERPAWTDPTVDWSKYALALLRTPWDYAWKRDAFVAWADRTAHRTRLLNPPDIVRWNTDKRYLRDLAERGVPIAPTAWLEPGPTPELGALLAGHGWTRAFLKPMFGQTARETLRFDATPHGIAAARAHLDRLLPAEGFLLQPYLDRVETEGETSGIFFDGTLSHGVQKIPVAGDYRVQDDFGASDRPATLDEEALDVCRRALDAVPGAEPLLYARVDLMRDLEGRWVLTELELVEPSLFFRHDPRAADRLADALIRRLR